MRKPLISKKRKTPDSPLKRPYQKTPTWRVRLMRLQRMKADDEEDRQDSEAVEAGNAVERGGARHGFGRFRRHREFLVQQDRGLAVSYRLSMTVDRGCGQLAERAAGQVRWIGSLPFSGRILLRVLRGVSFGETRPFSVYE